MKRLWFAILLSACLPAIAADSGDNPHPLPDDLILPMPEGHNMVFRPVFLDIGDGPFALRDFVMGSRAGDTFRETPTRVRLGGSFVSEQKGKRDWLYYIGKYEVTAAQFAGVMGTGPVNTGQENLPMVSISWLQIQEFIQKYNAWLLQNASNALPRKEGVVVRLPTEAEWEFAARGGIEVDEGRFDQKTPYPAGQVVNYEWFAGPRSSHGKLKAVGLLEPNPLGLHDILGNASEMVTGYYQVEYLQGRLGGLIARGGNFRTSESELRSAARTEIVPFREDGVPAAQETLGIRLVLAVPVFSSIEAIGDLEVAWQEYAKKRAAPAPSADSMAPVVDQTIFELADIDKNMRQMENSLPANARAEEAFQAKLNLLRASFATVDANIRRAEGIAANGATRLAYIGAGGLLDAYRRNQINQKFSAVSSPEEQNKQVQKFREEKDRSRERYLGALKDLAEVRPEVALTEFQAFIEELKRRENSANDVLAATLAVAHFKEYLRTRRFDMEKWETEFSTEAERMVNKPSSQ